MLSPPLDWVRELTMIQAESGIGHDALHAPVDVEAAYLRMLAGLLTSSSLMCEAAVTQAKYLTCMQMYVMGGPWPKLGTTMAGHKRLQNVATLLLNARSANVAGSYVECGVWRGGMSIFAKAVIEVYQMQRRVYLCDSFQGLPPPRSGSLRPDETIYASKKFNASLAKGEDTVTRNFYRFGVSMEGVRMVPGYFVDSLPGLRAELKGRGERLALLRLDGDMYDSTIDILYNLYDLVEVGGFIIIDDFGWRQGIGTSSRSLWGAKDAVLDFRALHGIEDDAHIFYNIDDAGAWFRKARHVEIRRHQYKRGVEDGNYSALRPMPLLTAKDYARLMHKYDAHKNDSHLLLPGRWNEAERKLHKKSRLRQISGDK